MPISPPPAKQYLGDGVYVESDDFRIITLTQAANTIQLTPEVWKKLTRWVEGD